SSQLSPESTRPLPQVGAQTLGAPVHAQPGSTRHVLEQPSPPATPPSSQPSSVCTTPSPHSAPQLPFVVSPSSYSSQSRASPSTSFATRQSAQRERATMASTSGAAAPAPIAGNAVARFTPAQRCATVVASFPAQSRVTRPLGSNGFASPVGRQLA